MGDEDGGGSGCGGGSEGREGGYKVHYEFSLWKLNKRERENGRLKGRDVSDNSHDTHVDNKENHNIHYVYH